MSITFNRQYITTQLRCVCVWCVCVCVRVCVCVPQRVRARSHPHVAALSYSASRARRQLALNPCSCSHRGTNSPPARSQCDGPPVGGELARPEMRVHRKENTGDGGGGQAGAAACVGQGGCVFGERRRAKHASSMRRAAALRQAQHRCACARACACTGVAAGKTGRRRGAHAAAPSDILTLLIKWSSAYPASSTTCAGAPPRRKRVGRGRAAHACAGARAAAPLHRGGMRRQVATLPATRVHSTINNTPGLHTSTAVLSSLCFIAAASFRSIFSGFRCSSGSSSVAAGAGSCFNLL